MGQFLLSSRLRGGGGGGVPLNYSKTMVAEEASKSRTLQYFCMDGSLNCEVTSSMAI